MRLCPAQTAQSGQQKTPPSRVSTYVYAAWKRLGGEEQVEIELISPCLQSPVGTENLLILKQRRVAMSAKFGPHCAPDGRGDLCRVDRRFVCRAVGAPVDADVAMKRHRE